MKIVSTGTALAMLGPAYQIRTELQTTGSVDANGRLDGDLILKGGGDPTLAAEDATPLFAQWTAALREAGIQSVGGAVIADETRFDTRLVADAEIWIDLGNYFGAGSSALSILKNEYRLTFRTGAPGTPAPLLETAPTPPGVTFVNEMRAGPHESGDEGFLFAGPYANVVYLRGTLPPGRSRFTIRGALPDPALYAATAFQTHLAEQGVAVEEPATTSRLLAAADKAIEGARTTLATVRSEPLSVLLLDTNRWSRNLNADCLLKLVGAETYGEGSFANGVKAAKSFWKERDVDLATAEILDGSGLARANLISARQMAQLLLALHRSPVGEIFRNSLPVAGRSGTIRNFGNGTRFEGRLQAKTGTMDRIKCIAGYLKTDSGREYVVVFFLNHYTGSHAAAVRAMETVLESL